MLAIISFFLRSKEIKRKVINMGRHLRLVVVVVQIKSETLKKTPYPSPGALSLSRLPLLFNSILLPGLRNLSGRRVFGAK